MSIFCITALRNEARYLPGFLRHIRDHVDGIVALDDGSTDDTLAFLKAEPCVQSILHQDHAGPAHGRETENRFRLMREAARLGARWVLCADADERYETRFLERLRAEAEAGDATGQILRNVRIVNLWNSPSHYRIDGVCRPRWTVRMFRLPATFSQRPAALHRPWFPPELDDAAHIQTDAFLYHLRMIERSDRQARFAKFRSVDPDNAHQGVGYEHLIDEVGLSLKEIAPGRFYVDDVHVATTGVAPATNFPVRAEFDEQFYLNNNIDVLKAVLAGQAASGFDHFLSSGCDEGRIWRRRLRLTGFDFPALVTDWRRRSAPGDTQDGPSSDA